MGKTNRAKGKGIKIKEEAIKLTSGERISLYEAVVRTLKSDDYAEGPIGGALAHIIEAIDNLERK